MEDLPEEIEFHENLKRQVDIGRQKLHEALAEAAAIPVPGTLQQQTEEERLLKIKEVVERGESVRASVQSDDVIKVRLFETPTIFLFELTPRGYAQGTDEAERLVAENKALKEASEKGSIARSRDGFTQTVSRHYYNESVITEPIQKEDESCTASEWRLHDALFAAEKKEILSENEDPFDGEVKDGLSEEEENCLQRFRNAATIVCRVLASNTFAKEQITFSHKHQPSRLMSYKLELLWTLRSSESWAVNSICLNPHNPKILGIGYGNRDGEGRVLVWNIKNPEAPEREAVTKRAVTCVQFSSSQPRLLGAVTRDGSVLLIDVSSEPVTITHVNSEEQPPFPEPLWSLAWFSYSDGIDESERLLTVGQSGQLWLWDPIRKKENMNVATLSFVAAPDPELTIKVHEFLGQDLKELFPEDDSSHGEHFLEVPYIGLHIAFNPQDKSNVYVTTDVGCIIEVNMRRGGVRWKRVIGHRLSVFGLAFSPYISSIYLTNSTDGDVSIWIQGFDKPLLQLRISDINLYGIDCAAWSPSHSTILVSLSREKVCLWDIARRIDRPMSTITGGHYTTLAFSHQGTNLLIGCNDGSVQVYRLSEMPHRPYMQRDHLEKAIRKALENKPDLLKAFNTKLST